jgi:hypothetical protein
MMTREEQQERIADLKQRQAEERAELDAAHQNARDDLARVQGIAFDELFKSLGARRDRG